MANQPRRLPATIARKIHFYRIDAGVDGGGLPIQFDPLPSLAAISALPFNNADNGRYMSDEDGNAIGAWPTVSNARTALRFCQVRRNGLPQVERAGIVNDLNIAADAGLLEPIHIVFFPNNIAGADFNSYGPRMSRLGSYLRVKSGGVAPFLNFQPLLRQDIAQQLNNLDDIRLFDLRIAAAHIDIVQMADQSLGAAFEANARLLDGNTEDIQIVLRPGRDQRRRALRRLIDPIRNLLNNPVFRDGSERFQIKGRRSDTGKTDMIDLLHDQLIVTKEILRVGERSRAVQPESAYAAIENAFAELRQQLQDAAGMVQ